MGLKIAVVLIALYGLILMAVWLGQRRLMYVPDVRRVAPASVGLSGVTEHELPTPDGERLIAWRLQAQPGQPTLLYFHGNAGNLASRAGRIERYRRAGLGLLMIGYRGYGGSTGSPSERANVADAKLAYDWLRQQGLDASDIVLYGESLGSGVAVQLAVEREVAALVLDAPYTSVIEMGIRTYPFLPVRALISDRYESDMYIRQVKAPVLVLHGERDGIIPVTMGTALFARANEPKKLVLFPEGRHSDLDEYGAVEITIGWLHKLEKR